MFKVIVKTNDLPDYEIDNIVSFNLGADIGSEIIEQLVDKTKDAILRLDIHVPLTSENNNLFSELMLYRTKNNFHITIYDDENKVGFEGDFKDFSHLYLMGDNDIRYSLSWSKEISLSEKIL